MTSAGYARDTTWTPLPSDARKWESSDTMFAPSAARPPPPDMADAGPDYAAEAAFEGGRAPPRPEAPILREHHVWGVREDWGRKAGAWGKGAKVYDDDEGSRK
jgi:protein AFG1